MTTKCALLIAVQITFAAISALIFLSLGLLTLYSLLQLTEGLAT